MFSKTSLIGAALLGFVLQSASAIELKINAYTGNSVTFTLSGAMPSTNPGTLSDGPYEIDLAYTGTLWNGGKSAVSNTLSASPIVGSGPLLGGSTGGFAGVDSNYSWLYFANDLTGLQGSGQQVMLSWGGANLLNTFGTGTMDLYWGNLTDGADPTGSRNILLSSVRIVDGRIVDANAVPEPASLALLGISAIGLAAARRRKGART